MHRQASAHDIPDNAQRAVNKQIIQMLCTSQQITLLSNYENNQTLIPLPLPDVNLINRISPNVQMGR